MSTLKDTWMSRTFKKFAIWLALEKSQLHDLTLITNNIGNAIVIAAKSPEWQVLVDVLEKAIPASTGLVDAFTLFLPKLMVRLKWVADETGKTDEQIGIEGLNYIGAIHVSDPDVFATQINSFVSLSGKFFSDNQGIGATIQQFLTTTQIVHNPDIINLPIGTAA